MRDFGVKDWDVVMSATMNYETDCDRTAEVDGNKESLLGSFSWNSTVQVAIDARRTNENSSSE